MIEPSVRLDPERAEVPPRQAHRRLDGGQHGRRLRNGVVRFAPFLVALAVLATWYAVTRPLLTGDEPHYLVQAASLAFDGDLDLGDDYADPDGVSSLAPGIEGERGLTHVVDIRGDGRLRPVQGVGLPVLLAPVLLIDFSINAVRIAMVLVAAVFAHQLFGLMADVVPSRRWTRWLVWSGACLTLPVIGFANQLYPETVAALVVTVSARLLWRAGNDRRAGFAAALLAATLPWFHVRFGLLAVGLVAVSVAVVVVAAVGDRWRESVGAAGRRAAAVAWLPALPLIVSVAFLGLLFWYLYGDPSPTAPYSAGQPGQLLGGAPERAGLGFDWMQVYRVGIGQFLSPTGGLLPFSPVHWVGLVGLVAFARRFGPTGWFLLAVAVGHALVVIPLGAFGYSLPGRFPLVLVPLLAVSALVVVEGIRWMPVVYGGLLALSAWIALQGWAPGRYGLLYDVGRVKAPVVRSLESWWPKFVNADGVNQFFYEPDKADRDVGTVVDPPDAPPAAVATPADGGGLLSAGPEFEVREGVYTLTVVMAAEGPVGEPAAKVEVVALPDEVVMAREDVQFGTVAEPGGLSFVRVPFAVPDVSLVEVRVDVTGAGTVEVGSIDAQPVLTVGRRDRPVRRQMPLGFLWMGATLAASIAADRALARREGSAPQGTSE